MCIRCFYCCCGGCRCKNPESKSMNLWLTGRFKTTDEINNPSTKLGISTIETITVENRRTANIEKQQPRKSFTSKSTNNVTFAPRESPRNSNFSDSTFGDISQIDVRLDIFEEDRFRDISEAIFKKHS